jgi:class 3 adenylate cyclase
VSFFLFVLLGVVLASVLWRTLTQPITETAMALREIRAGNLDVGVAVESGDEIGLLQDGVNAMVANLRERERILQTFGRVVEPAVRDHLLSGNLEAAGEARFATVMFCDLRGFTSLAEQSHPAEMLQGLNEFFTLMTLWVRECGGFVNKFLGDAMMIVFGLFESDDLDWQARAAAAAVRCGRGVPERLAELNSRRAERGLPPLAVSIGIHSGEVVAGAIGAQDRHEYSVIGDTVNVAARLQELCKEREGFMLVSRQTSELAARAGTATEGSTHQPVALRGRREPVDVLAVR